MSDNVVHNDLLTCKHNGMLAVKPTKEGLLAHLHETKRCPPDQHSGSEDLREIESIWVFAGLLPWVDEQRNMRVNTHLRGVLNGSYTEGEAFLEECRDLGFKVMSVPFFVPFSNGPKRFGRFADGTRCKSFYEHELLAVRTDLPDREDLLVIIAKSMRGT